MKPAQYVASEIEAGRIPSMPIIALAGAFYLCDGDWNILRGGKTYVTKDAAMTDRSRILDRANKKIE